MSEQWIVVCTGIGTVFIGLILIILLCKVVSICCNAFIKPAREDSVAPPITKNDTVENRQEILAAVCAACAEDMGTDVSALRVVSFKKL